MYRGIPTQLSCARAWAAAASAIASDGEAYNVVIDVDNRDSSLISTRNEVTASRFGLES
jgi:hypothetical protein